MDIRRLLVASLALLAAFPAAQAQTTDGYHAIQVFPVVVDTASFTQRFHFRATYPWDITHVLVTYYPARGTGITAPITCQGFGMLPGGETRFASLRALCPGLPAGSAFGTLVLRNNAAMAFAGSSRVSNAAGQGFTVEAFPANSFTSALSAVTGLRRLAAQAGAPAFQSNCFVGNLAELAPAGATVATDVVVGISDHEGDPLGATVVSVQPGELVRLLDVFAAANVAAGNVDDAVATFTPGDGAATGLMAFCTVQDNSSYGADFRIAKQEIAWGGTVPGAQDWGANRWSFLRHEEAIDDETEGAMFRIPAGESRNIHLFYFRHPDVVGCFLYNQNDALVNSDYGLELRLRVHSANGWQVLAGGNDMSEFGLYLGDKARHGLLGSNTVYQVEVESNGRNSGVDRPYMLGCVSGSGHSRGELLRKGLPTRF